MWPSWLGRLVWDQEILGSSPSTPTTKTPVRRGMFFVGEASGGGRLKFPRSDKIKTNPCFQDCFFIYAFGLIYKHGVSVAVKSVFFLNSFLVRLVNVFFARERAYEHQKG